MSLRWFGVWLVAGLCAAAATVTAQTGDQPLSLDDLESLEALEALDALDALIEEEASTASAAIGVRTLIDVGALALVLSLALSSFLRKSDPLKVVSLVVSVAYLGFYKASLASVVDIFGAMQLSLPTFSTSVAYYALIAFTVVSTVFWGRVYCGRICAFGALTQLMDRIIPSRFRVELPPWLDRRVIYIKYVVLAGAILYVLGGGSTLVYRYIEPFWLFTLSGNPVMWALLGCLLLTTVFVRNFYCRYLCSVGAGLGLLSALTLFPIKRWSECQTCKICEKTCEWGAIRGPEIIKSECVRCDDCERVYADTAKCPHWLILAHKKKSIPVVTTS